MLTSNERKQRYWGVGITLGSVLASFILNLGLKIPFLSCPLLKYTGIPCPAWGLTRSFVATAHGQFTLALNYHLFGSFLFIIFTLLGLHLTLELVKDQKINYFYILIIKQPQYQLFFFFLLLGYHGFRLLELSHSGRLFSSFLASPLGLWLFP